MDIYDQHARAFARVTAYVIVKNGGRIGTVAIKYPANDVGRLYAYVHVFPNVMVRGSANGYGYDTRSGAVESAVANMIGTDPHTLAIKAALAGNEGYDWDRRIRGAGYSVFGAV